MAIEKFFAPVVAGGIIAAEVGKGTIQAAKALKSQVGTRSLTRLAKDSIFQFPTIMSASIDTDEISVMAKALEKNYASLMLSAITLGNTVNHAKYDTVADFLKTFHTNMSAPEVISNNTFLESVSMTEDDIMSLWDIASEQVDMEPLNSIYQPYTRSKRILTNCLESMTAATEADNDTYNAIKSKVTDEKQRTAFFNDHKVLGAVKGVTDEINSKEAKPFGAGDIQGKNVQNISYKNAIIESREVASLAPTMINVTLVNYDTQNGSSAMWNQDVIIGIKSMIRMVRSNFMVANMVEAAKDSFPFKFIAWTKHEYKLTDLIFGIASEKDMALATPSNRWMKALKNRRRDSALAKFIPGMKKLMPNTTIIMTEGEAIMVKDACGVDLHDLSKSKHLIKQFMLLGFGIYDTETKILNMLFDGDMDYTDTSLRQLTALVRKDTNLLIENR